MLDHDESFLVFSSVVFDADMWDRQLLNLSSTCLHINTHRNHNNNVYIVILIFFRGYLQDICKHCHEADDQF